MDFPWCQIFMIIRSFVRSVVCWRLLEHRVVWVMISSNSVGIGGSLARGKDFETNSIELTAKAHRCVPPLAFPLRSRNEMEIEQRSISSIRSLTEIPARLPTNDFAISAMFSRYHGLESRADEEISLPSELGRRQGQLIAIITSQTPHNSVNYLYLISGKRSWGAGRQPSHSHYQ